MGYLLTSETGLLKTSKKSEKQDVNSDQRAKNKTQVQQKQDEGNISKECLLNYHIGVADAVVVKDSETNGSFLVKKVTHEGARDGDGTWKTTLELKPLAEGGAIAQQQGEEMKMHFYNGEYYAGDNYTGYNMPDPADLSARTGTAEEIYKGIDNVEIMARAIYGEARENSFEKYMVAVVYTMYNRLEQARLGNAEFKNTLRGVMLQKDAYTGLLRKETLKISTNRVDWNAYVKCYDIAKLMIGCTKNLTSYDYREIEKVTGYHNPIGYALFYKAQYTFKGYIPKTEQNPDRWVCSSSGTDNYHLATDLAEVANVFYNRGEYGKARDEDMNAGATQKYVDIYDKSWSKKIGQMRKMTIQEAIKEGRGGVTKG